MIEFSFFPTWLRLTVQFVLLAALAVQVLVCMLSFYSRSFEKRLLPRQLLEAAISLQTAICVLLMGNVEFNLNSSMAAAGERFIFLRYALCLMINICSVFSYVWHNKLWDIAYITFSVLILPIMEKLLGAAFAYVFMANAAVTLARAICVLVFISHELKEGLSGLSIKEAIDSLPTAMLFADRSGYILLMNRTMQKLVSQLSLERTKNAVDMLSSIPDCFPDNVESFDIGDTLAVKTPDGHVWQLEHSFITIGSKQYIELYAPDITEQWRLAEALESERRALSAQKRHLIKMLINIEEIRRGLELQSQKAKVHDVLGQRVTMLDKAIREGKALDMELLEKDICSLISELDELPADDARDPESALASLKEMFSQIGVEVEFSGSVCENRKIAACMNAILRECVTNAVRHGFASSVKAKYAHIPNGWRLTVSDNGEGSEYIIEGGGITGMRRRAQALGGTIRIATTPSFTVTAEFIEAQIKP